MELAGLSSQDIKDKIAKGLQNKSSKTTSKKVSRILLDNFFSVFNLIILLIIIYLFIFYLRTNDKRLLLDSIGSMSVALINTLLAVFQEIRAKIALDKVNLLLKKVVKVVRDGTLISIEQSEIVQDDVIFIERGDQAGVDGEIYQANRLEIDESLLTGESIPIEKKDGDKILSGSFCVSGNGYYIARKVGDESYASGIIRLAKKFRMNLTPLQVKINLMVKSLFASAVVLVVLEIIFRDISFGYVESVRKISTIMLSLVPQGLVLMSSVTFAIGVYRISRIGAIIQRLNAIESFSNVKVVCTDKTGTLTQNKLSVYSVTPLNNSAKEEIENLLGTYAKYSSDKNATLRTLEQFESLPDVKLLDEIPFSSENKMSIIKIENGKKEMILVLGGFDILIDKIEPNKQSEVQNIFSEKKLDVYRNLLFGKVASDIPLNLIKGSINKLKIEPFCIVSITDLIRKDVFEAIELFRKNEIQVKILSGDSAPAIQAVAREIGWQISDSEMISGNDIDSINDENLPKIIKEKSIFARLKPEHKLKIIRALKKEKIYTAMIGDGVNDLPAIKESNLGIAMEEGSSITKEVSDIVLLKNKFSLLPDIFNEGNRIVNTVNSVAKLFLTKNFLVIFLTLMSLFFMFQFPLTPRRVALINIFSVGLPALIIAFKNANVSKSVNFMKDLISFVLLSALIIACAAYTGEYFTKKYFEISHTDLQMVMMSIMIIISISNYLAVALHKGEKNFNTYLWFAIIILGFFIVLAVTQFKYPLFRLLKEFYEVYYLKPDYWGIVLLVSLISSGLLLILQLLRERIIKKY
ncbi:MAG: HAD-IC family P-type ATPase [Ignavibacteria bacterium]